MLYIVWNYPNYISYLLRVIRKLDIIRHSKLYEMESERISQNIKRTISYFFRLSRG